MELFTTACAVVCYDELVGWWETVEGLSESLFLTGCFHVLVVVVAPIIAVSAPASRHGGWMKFKKKMKLEKMVKFEKETSDLGKVGTAAFVARQERAADF